MIPLTIWKDLCDLCDFLIGFSSIICLVPIGKLQLSLFSEEFYEEATFGQLPLKVLFSLRSSFWFFKSPAKKSLI